MWSYFIFDGKTNILLLTTPDFRGSSWLTIGWQINTLLIFIYLFIYFIIIVSVVFRSSPVSTTRSSSNQKHWQHLFTASAPWPDLNKTQRIMFQKLQALIMGLYLRYMDTWIHGYMDTVHVMVLWPRMHSPSVASFWCYWLHNIRLILLLIVLSKVSRICKGFRFRKSVLYLYLS